VASIPVKAKLKRGKATVSSYALSVHIPPGPGPAIRRRRKKEGLDCSSSPAHAGVRRGKSLWEGIKTQILLSFSNYISLSCSRKGRNPARRGGGPA